MQIINSKNLEKVIYNLCLQAGQELTPFVYTTILNKYNQNKSEKLAHIIQNANKANLFQRPLCQDTGTVHVFLEVGNEVSFSDNPILAINNAVRNCYIEQFFRKSIVENGFISGKNTEDNTPALVDITYVKGNELKINVLLKGAGCDNVSTIKMMLPTITKEEFVDFVVNTILEKGKNACPPLFVSVATGTGAEKVMIEAEKAYFNKDNSDIDLSKEIISKVNELASKEYENFLLADLKITYKPHHMASFPVAICINCHSLRTASATISSNNIFYSKIITNFKKIPNIQTNAKEIFTENIEEIQRLKNGDKVLITGEILIARDSAHKKMLKMKQNNEKIPFDLKNKFIFYSAPTPPKENEIVGSIGPTTSQRMDKYLLEFKEVFATIGKGKRSKEAEKIIKANKSVYFEVEGGISTLLSSCFEEYKVIAFEELSTEAVCLAKVKQLPAIVSII